MEEIWRPFCDEPPPSPEDVRASDHVEIYDSHTMIFPCPASHSGEFISEEIQEQVEETEDLPLESVSSLQSMDICESEAGTDLQMWHNSRFDGQRGEDGREVEALSFESLDITSQCEEYFIDDDQIPTEEDVTVHSSNTSAITNVSDIPSTPKTPSSWSSNNPYLKYIDAVELESKVEEIHVQGFDSAIYNLEPDKPVLPSRDPATDRMECRPLGRPRLWETSTDFSLFKSESPKSRLDTICEDESEGNQVQVALNTPSIPTTISRSMRFADPLVIQTSTSTHDHLDTELEAKTKLVFPVLMTDLGIWTKEALDEYQHPHPTDPSIQTPFRKFLLEGRVIEWRRYRVHHTFVAARYRNEFLVVKVQASGNTYYLQIDRLTHPKDADLWERYDQRWLQWVADECHLNATHVTVASSNGKPWKLDQRLIWGLWTPYDHLLPLKDWPHKDDVRETQVYTSLEHQPDLLDLLIAARMVHLDASFNLYKRQNHWFTKMLSRILNHKYDRNDVKSTADKKKYDKKFDPVAAKWEHSRPVSDIRHEKVLGLRNCCVEYREEINKKASGLSPKSLVQANQHSGSTQVYAGAHKEGAPGNETMSSLDADIYEGTQKAKGWSIIKYIWKAAEEGEPSRPRKLQKPRKPQRKIEAFSTS
ncbi:hypothetical protein C0991_003168 [Blastosporella zonata]|nr:hypothetical protein C0991_003168 [Blastosporella zonata]